MQVDSASNVADPSAPKKEKNRSGSLRNRRTNRPTPESEEQVAMIHGLKSEPEIPTPGCNFAQINLQHAKASLLSIDECKVAELINKISP